MSIAALSRDAGPGWGWRGSADWASSAHEVFFASCWTAFRANPGAVENAFGREGCLQRFGALLALVMGCWSWPSCTGRRAAAAARARQDDALARRLYHFRGVRVSIRVPARHVYGGLQPAIRLHGDRGRRDLRAAGRLDLSGCRFRERGTDLLARVHQPRGLRDYRRCTDLLGGDRALRRHARRASASRTRRPPAAVVIGPARAVAKPAAEAQALFLCPIQMRAQRPTVAWTAARTQLTQLWMQAWPKKRESMRLWTAARSRASPMQPLRLAIRPRRRSSSPRGYR